jgi:hypothetical protein
MTDADPADTDPAELKSEAGDHSAVSESQLQDLKDDQARQMAQMKEYFNQQFLDSQAQMMETMKTFFISFQGSASQSGTTASLPSATGPTTASPTTVKFESKTTPAAAVAVVTLVGKAPTERAIKKAEKVLVD